MNQQMNEKIMGFTEHNGNASNGEALIDKLNIKSLEIYENLKISLDSILNCFTSYYQLKMYNDPMGFLDQYTRAVWMQFSTTKYSLCMARAWRWAPLWRLK